MWRPFKSRRASGEDVPTPQDTETDIPRWVSEFRRWGVPVSAVLVLGLCAPGERYLADLVGWSSRMSWGLAGLFTLYAGLASVISTQLPKGARGKGSSIVGAALSLALAMGAQPVAHMFATGYLTAEPRPPLWLVITVSSVPPLVLGHLLHFAAMPPRVRRTSPVAVSRPDTGQDVSGATVTVLRPRTAPQRPVPAVSPAPRPVPAVTAAPRPATVSLSKTPSRPAVSTGQPSRPSMSARALSLLGDGTPQDKVAEILRTEYVSEDGTPPKTNTVRKSITRAQDKLSSRP